MKIYGKKILNYFSFDLNTFSLKFMTSNFLKIIAVAAMFVDHSAIILVQEPLSTYFLMRKIGRIVFVTYAFLSCIAIYNTRKPEVYLIRTFILAVLFQIFVAATSNLIKALDPYYLNIFFVIFFGTLTIYAIRKNPFLGLITFICIVAFYFIYVNINLLFNPAKKQNYTIDYTLYGYFLIVAMGICFYFQKRMPVFLFKLLIIAVFVIINLIFRYVLFTNEYLVNVWNIGNLQIYSLFAIPFFLFYNQKDHYRNRYVKWAFITAYPFSFIIPGLIALI